MIALLLLACTSPCDPGPEPSFEIGAGAAVYRPLTDGETIDIVYGAQGGYHVDLAVQAAYFDSADVITGDFTGSFDGVDVAFAEPWFTLACVPDADAQQAAGIRLIFDGLIPPELDGRTLEIRGTITDARGISAEASRTVVLRDPV